MTLSANSKKEERELLNALRADSFVYDLANSDDNLTLVIIREVNGIILHEVIESSGAFRKQNVQISGASFQPPDFMEVPPLMDQMLEAFNGSNNLHPVLRSAWIHATFTRIHPFIDGNGRTGRLLQDFTLLKGGLYPTGIPSSLRDDYYDALERADSGEWDQICQMICRIELGLISRVQSIVDEIKSRGAFIEMLAAKARERKIGTLHKKYVVWRQRMENFINLLETTCSEINKASDVIQIQVELYEIVDFDKRKQISDTGRAEGTWAAKLNWLVDGEQLYRSILYFKRHINRPDDVFTRDELYGAVALRLTGGEPVPGARFNFDNFQDPMIRFREVLFIDDQLHLLSATGQTRSGKYGEEEVWQTDSLPEGSVAIQGLIQDVFMRKLGLGG